MRQLLILFLCLLTLGACQEDYVYPSVITEFMDARTNEEGKLTRLITDTGDTLRIQERSGLDGLAADSTYRTITIYERLEEASSQALPLVKVYSVQQILSIPPIGKNNFSPGEIRTDPLDIQSIWRSGNYLNLILRPLVKEGKHIYMVAETDMTSHTDGHQTLHLMLYHDRNGDEEAFTRKTYLSIPLTSYQGRLKKGDSITLQLNTYQEGMTSRSFAY